MADGIHDELRDLSVPLDQLHPYHRNARQGDTILLAESLREHGQFRPIVVNKGSKTGRPDEILAGNHTYLAAKSLGWKQLAATWVDVDDSTAARIVLVDNRSTDVATYDDRLLAELLQDMDGDLLGTGYTEDDLLDLVNRIEAPDLDALGAQFGEPTDEDTLEKISIQVPVDVAAMWRTAGDSTGFTDGVSRDTALVRAAYTTLVGDPEDRGPEE